MKYFLLIIGIIVLTLNAWFMSKEYDKQHWWGGVVYWGFWTLIIFMALR